MAAGEYNRLYIKTEIKVEPEEIDEPDYDTPLHYFPSFNIKDEPFQQQSDEIETDIEEIPEKKKKKRHKLVKVKEKPPQQSFVCTICNLIFETKSKYSSHMKIHKEATHQCSKCDKKFKSLKNMEKHTCAICKVCGEKTISNAMLRIHMNQQHSEAALQLYLVECDYCGIRIKTKHYLIRHMRAEHVKDEKTNVLCSLCGTKFPHKAMLDKHIKTKHTEMESCKLCGKFVKPLCMPYHMKQVHASERNFLCTICSASFKTKCNYTDHLKTHNKIYVCDICFKKFARPDHLREHRLLHTDPDALTCMICNHRYSSFSYLKRHMKAHENNNIQCKICGIEVNALSIHYHMKNSHPFNRFNCTKCNATGFGSQKEFNEHLRGHEKERVELEKQKQIQKLMEDEMIKQEKLRKEKEQKEAIENMKKLAQSLEIPKIEVEKKKEEKKQDEFVPQMEDFFDGYSSDNDCGDDGDRNDDYDSSQEFNQEKQSDSNQQQPQVKVEIKEEDADLELIQQHQGLTNPFDTFICDIIQPRKRQGRRKKPESWPRWITLPKDAMIICDCCGDEFDKKSKLLVHIRKHNVDDYKCRFCHKLFEHKSLLLTHLKSHDETLVACELCGKEVKPWCMPNHIRQVHTIYKTLECETCGKVFKTKQNLREHQMSHNKSFQCWTCGKKFTRSFDLNQHRLVHDAPELLHCPVCNLMLADQKTLKNHMQNMHVQGPDGIMKKKEKTFKCELCDYSCALKGGLKIHYRKHENYEQRKQRLPNALTCSICNGLFTTEILLRMHHNKVHSDERFPCTLCPMTLKTKNALFNHMRKIHHTEPDREKYKKPKKPRTSKPTKLTKSGIPRKRRRKRNDDGLLIEKQEAEDGRRNPVNVIEFRGLDFY